MKIDGNPGSGNTFQEIHIGTVQNFNPNATTVINYNGVGDDAAALKGKPSGQKTMKQMLDNDLIDRTPIYKEIMNYVSCLRTFVSEAWKDRYMQLWADILNLSEVADLVCDPGKQQGTNFNRKLLVAGTFFTEGMHFVLTIPILIAIMLYYHVVPQWWSVLPNLAVCLVSLALISTGISYFYAAANLWFRDLERIMGIFLMAWCFISPVRKASAPRAAASLQNSLPAPVDRPRRRRG